MKRSLLIVVFLVSSFFSFPFFAEALTVSPAKIEISGDPGQTLQGEILLLEEAENGKNYYISVENFEPRGDSGAPYFIGSKDGLATWISVGDQIYANQNQETSIPFSITIPSSAKPGGYFAAIFFGTQPINGMGGGQVSVGGKVGVLILLRVNGDIEEGGGLLSFTLKEEKRIMSVPPVILEYRFNNTGGDRVVPRGTVRLLNTFRFKAEEVSANQNEGSVLPGSARRFELVASDNKLLPTEDEVSERNFFDIVKIQLKDFKFGWYTAKLDIEWGDTKQSARESYHFFVFPWQALVVLGSLFFVVIKIFKFILRRYNAKILAQAGINQGISPQAHKERSVVRQTQVGGDYEKNIAYKSEHNPARQDQQKQLQKPRRKI